MAKNKKSFLLYCDLIHSVENMTDDEAGKLMKHLLRYVNDLNPEPPDRVTSLLFEPIKQQLKRDLVKWSDKSEKASERGRLGGLKSGEIRAKQKEANASLNEKNEAIGSKTQANEAVNVSVSDNVNVKEKKIVNSIDSRKLKFASTLEPFSKTYTRDMLLAFYKYWTEPNKSNTKFRQELEKTWDLSRRLETWSSKDFNFKKNNNGTKQPKPSKIDSISTAYHEIVKSHGLEKYAYGEPNSTNGSEADNHGNS